MVKTFDIDLQALVAILPDAALLVSPDGRIALANERAAELFGYPRSTLESMSIEMLVPEDVRAVHRDQRTQYMANAEARPMGWGRRLSARKADGSRVPVDVSLSPFRTEDEILVLACIRDRTPYEQLIASLAEAEARYRQVVESASEVFYRVMFHQGDPLRQGCIYVSPQCQQISGRSPDEFLGNPTLWFESIHEEDRPSVIEDTLRCINTKTPVTRYYRLRDHATGEFRWLADRIVPLLGPKGQVVGYQGVARDITERREAEERQRRLEGQLDAAQKIELIGRLAAGVAHDFNNVLAAIVGSCEMALAELDQDNPAAGDLRQALDAARRGAELTRQLLAVGRRQTIAPRVLNLRGHIQAMQELLRSVVPESICIRCSLPEELWPVRMDPGQVDQVVINLVINARDAMPGGGLIAIEAVNVIRDEAYSRGRAGFVPGEYVCLTVRDTGQGMDSDTLEHAFEPFFTTKTGRGTGLGLASVYGIVKQNHGYIELTSQVGHGTSVVIHLPRSRDEQVEGPTVADRSPAGALRGTVLLVDDNDQVRHVTRRLLERFGCEVRDASGPEAALAICDGWEGEIDVLLTDLVMPVMDGVALAREVTARRFRTVVIYMSGYGERESFSGVVPESSLQLAKPFDVPALEHAVRMALSRRQQSGRN
jgi:PAS domain S-box-containing protein